MSRRRVVITGLGVVAPIGVGVPAFFDGLRRAAPGVDNITRFDASAFPTRVAGEVRGVDPSRVSLPAEEGPALRRDPKALYGLLAGREALEAAGFAADWTPAMACQPERVAVLLAAGLEIFHLGDVVHHLARGKVDGEALLAELQRHPPGSRLQIPAHLGARCLAREAGARGLFSVNVSACAAGTQAVGEAFHAVAEGAADLALTGGYDSMVNPLGLGGFTLLDALSTANERRGGASRPFDAERDGFVLGEGAAVLVLESEESARRRGVPIRGEVLGFASSLDAFHFTDPDPEHGGAVSAMRGALDAAGLAPSDIDYVNAHGTATPKNDPAETRAIRAVFGAHADHLPVSSTKSQVGHLIGAAGAVELAAVLFALEQGLLPATINLEHPDPQCDLDYVPRVPRPCEVRAALSNSFGFGGQNASIVVGRYKE